MHICISFITNLFRFFILISFVLQNVVILILLKPHTQLRTYTLISNYTPCKHIPHNGKFSEGTIFRNLVKNWISKMNFWNLKVSKFSVLYQYVT